MRLVDGLCRALLVQWVPKGLDGLLRRVRWQRSLRIRLALLLLPEDVGMRMQCRSNQVPKVALLRTSRCGLQRELLMTDPLEILVVASAVLAAYASSWSP
jgi:hypothetical protein